jgi:2-polyprenyl-6-methoxyphenol hydroxylase-like FAD-dependent oxidoreductase
MADTVQSFDAVIVGGSLAGCAAATMLGRAGARVAVVEKSPDPAAFKRMCSHFIQASAVPTLERLDLVEPMVEAGAVCSHLRTRVPWGWVVAPPEKAAVGIDLRREQLDPLVREMAASTPGVEVLMGRTVTELRRAGGRVRGVVARNREGAETTFEAPLTIGADGRDSLVAKLSGVKVKTYPHGRFAYGGYFEDMELAGAPDVSMWMMDPEWAAAFPTDGGLTFCAAMPTKDHLAEFKADPAEAMAAYFEKLPETPSLRSARLVDDPGVIGKIDMTNRMRTPTAPGLALIGDAALATDPLFGVGCGWAFQSAEWLADAVAPALRGEAELEAGLRGYRRAHSRHLRGHAYTIHDYSKGRKMLPGERLVFSAATRSPRVAQLFEEFGTRQIGPARMMSRAVPLALATNARHAVRQRRGHGGPEPRAGAGTGADAGAGAARSGAGSHA